MRRRLVVLADLAGTTLLVLLIGFLAGLIVAGMAGQQCPTEDSCRADYVDGRYVIYPTVP